mmetsp:Transcript_35213/g.91491  ORF Transcript_35213/g.91491 Transcript_35213/m.91491 type:complete len:116 (+) Transcript_35213:859-1206(+)
MGKPRAGARRARAMSSREACADGRLPADEVLEEAKGEEGVEVTEDGLPEGGRGAAPRLVLPAAEADRPTEPAAAMGSRAAKAEAEAWRGTRPLPLLPLELATGRAERPAASAAGF